MTNWLHEQRLEAAHQAVRDCGARSVLDLGCGDGDLLTRLALEPCIRRIVGVDLCSASLDRLRKRLEELDQTTVAQVQLIHGSFTEPQPAFGGFDCAVLIETIEHIDPDRLSVLENSLFGIMRPRTVIITTPNAEYNPLLGVPAGRFRHPDHRFEWGREKFHHWAGGVSRRNGYSVNFRDLAGEHQTYGGASQMAVFKILQLAR